MIQFPRISFECNGITVALLFFAQMLFAQSTQSFSNPAPIIINQVGHSSSQYPSTIAVTGMPQRMHEFVVHFDVIANGGFPDADILLEAPDGQRIILLSDLPLGGIWSFTNLGIGTNAHDTINKDNIYDNKNFRPANYDTGADNFPSPGPGMVMQPQYPDALVLQDINPNGTWKLYIEDDANNTADLRLQNGWSIEITAASFNACKRPGVPQIVAPSDFGATLSWTAGAATSNWDFIFTQNLNLNPVTGTTPTHDNVTQNQNVFLDGLEPSKFYAVFARADCGNGKVSPWVGPTFFQTTIHPCELATPVSLCQAVDYPTLPSYYEYFFDYGPTWTFAFTAPEAGEFYMEFEGTSGFAPFYRLDNLNNCDDGQWFEMAKLPGQPLTFKLPYLAAGQTCWIIHHNVQIAHEIFRIVKCPLRRMVLDGVNPATDSLRAIWQNVPPITDPLEFYIGKKPLTAPDDSSTPTLSGIILPPATGQVTFANLEADTDYQFYVRARCSDGRTSCWQGPFEGKTDKLCSKVSLVRVDTVTAAWAEATLKFTNSGPNGVSTLNARVCRSGQDPTYDWVGKFSLGVSPAADTLTMLFHSLPMSEPLKFYVKAGCWTPFGAQPWQGPFDLPASHTPPVPVDDLFCGESVEPEDPYDPYTNYMSLPNPCYNYPYNSFGERIFRYRSNADDTISLRWNSGFTFSELDDGVAYYVKSASLPLDSANWEYLGCWKLKQFANIWDPANWPDIRIPVKKDSIYHIFCDVFNSSGVTFPIIVGGCQVICPSVDTLILDAVSSTTATLRWYSAESGANYQIDYRPAWTDNKLLERSATTTDTSITLTGLLPSGEYYFKIRTFCSPTNASNRYEANFQLSGNLIEKESGFSRCNPQFLPPGGTALQNYEVFEITASQDGSYFFNSEIYDTYIYFDVFDPADPLSNLLARVTSYGPDARKDTILQLQTGKTYYWVLSKVGNSFNLGGFNTLKISADGPAPLQISAPKWDGSEPKAHGKIPESGVFWHTGTCRDTSGWVHFYKIADDTNELQADALLLSVQLSMDENMLNALPMVLLDDPPAATLIQNPPAVFLQNPDGWYEMNRIWLMQDLLPAQQIDEDFNIRFYYTQHDYELMKAAIEVEGGKLDSHEAMYFHKINGFHNYQNVIPWAQHTGIPGAATYDDIGYWSYTNGSEASASTWKHGTFAGEHYAEMLVHGFSGGGGGASVNGKSISDPLSKTIDIGQKKGLLLLPNPNTGTFTVELPEAATTGLLLRITDISGRVLLEKTTEPGIQRQSLEAGMLPASMYFFQVVSGGTVLVVEKFIKQ